jgi:hypothetical protein
VRVITRTTGSDQDDDGYVVVVNGDARQVNTNSSITYEDISAGETVVEILGVAPNCSAAGQTYHEVRVTGGETLEITFAFDCSPRQPDTGTLQVAIATSGPSPDADGYVVTVDGGVGQPIASSATVLLTGLPIGERSIALTGIAANCAVSGANPRPATVTGTELGVVTFAVVCSQPPPATGTLRLTTATTGPDFDPTGYTIVVDGTVRQPVGVNATVAIAGLASGSHSVALSDITPNCTTTDNPRTISLPANGETAVTFAISCIPAFGYITTVTQTTGAATDPDGYVARVNGGAGKPVPANGTATRGGLAPGAHTVQLDNVEANCQVQGDNPRAVIVAGYETTTVTFEVLCGATTGSLALTVSGLPAGGAADISVTGPGGFERTFGGTAALNGLSPGVYTVTARAVTLNGTLYQPGALSQIANIPAGESVTVTVAYSSNPGGAINLRIAGMYVTQGTQTPEGEVPLVEGRDGYLRVFVLADGDNSVRPAVRVRILQNGAQVQSAQIEAPMASVPTVAQEQDLNASWNLRISGALIRRGLSIQADVDPGGTVAESDETDNVFPRDGNPGIMTVRAASVFAVTLVPIQMGSQGLVGDVSPSNMSRYLNTPQSVHPLPGIDAVLHGVFASSLSPTEAGGTNAALSYALSELLTLRAVEGSARSYYGVTHRSYSIGGFAGLGYIGAPAAVGYDDPFDAGHTAAHEFGHNWDRLHAPCGGPANADPQFPHVGGTIGQYGFDLANERLIPPTTHDFMSYCRPGWSSDYTYLGVMAFREQAGATTRSQAASIVQPCLVVWGRIENGRAVLEPAFLVHTRPLLPTKPGPHRLRGVNRAGGKVFDITFHATPVADDLAGAEHFAFAVPVDPSSAADLSSLRLESAVGLAEVSALTTPSANIQLAPQAQRVGQNVRLQWGVGSVRMAMVRDAATGEVLAFGRGGTVELSTRAARLDVYLSSGPASQRIQVPVAP